MFEENGRSHDEDKNNNNGSNIPPEILEFVKEYKFLREKAEKKRPGFLKKINDLIEDEYFGTCEKLGEEFTLSAWISENLEEIPTLLGLEDPYYRLSQRQIHRFYRIVAINYYEEYKQEPEREIHENYALGAYVYTKEDEFLILNALRTVYETKHDRKNQELIRGLEPLHFVDLCDKYLKVEIDRKDKNYLSVVYSLINDAIIKKEVNKICKVSPTKFYPTEDLLEFLKKKMSHRKFF